MVFLVYLLAFMPSWMICSSMLLRKWRKQEKKSLCGFQKANCRVLFHALDRLQAREKRALVHFLVGVIYFKKILPDFRFGRTYSLLMIVMLYQEYGNHGFGSQEEDVPSKAGQLFQGFSGRGIQAVAKARVQRKEHVYHVLMRLIFSPFPTPAAVCSQFFLRNDLFCSKIRTTRWSGALRQPKKKPVFSRAIPCEQSLLRSS